MAHVSGPGIGAAYMCWKKEAVKRRGSIPIPAGCEEFEQIPGMGMPNWGRGCREGQGVLVVRAFRETAVMSSVLLRDGQVLT